MQELLLDFRQVWLCVTMGERSLHRTHGVRGKYFNVSLCGVPRLRVWCCRKTLPESLYIDERYNGATQWESPCVGPTYSLYHLTNIKSQIKMAILQLWLPDSLLWPLCYIVFAVVDIPSGDSYWGFGESVGAYKNVACWACTKGLPSSGRSKLSLQVRFRARDVTHDQSLLWCTSQGHYRNNPVKL